MLTLVMSVVVLWWSVTIHGMRSSCQDGRSGESTAVLKLPADDAVVDSPWPYASLIASEVFNIQNRDLRLRTRSGDVHNNVTVIMFHESSSWKALADFENRILTASSKMIFLKMSESLISERDRSFLVSLSGNPDITNVVVFSDSVLIVTGIWEFVTSELAFRWTSFKHIAEWTVVSSSGDIADAVKNGANASVDFITLVDCSKASEIAVFQKSRKNKLNKVLMIEFDEPVLVKDGPGPGNETHLVSEKISGELDRIIVGWLRSVKRSLRPAARVYLKGQRSVLDGMVLDVAVVPEDEDKVAFRRRAGNTTVYDGYSIAVLNTLADTMGFSYRLVSSQDGGYYGAVLENEYVTGITGQLARREAALTTMPLSRIDNRMDVVAFVPVAITTEKVNVMYRLPTEVDHIDLTYLNIFQPEFFLILVGPATLLGVLGAVIHVITDSCNTPRPGAYTTDKLRMLTSFPDHICFHTERPYKVQSGLILRTSWAMFWFVISSAYSAYLVTTFTVKPPELALRSLQQLLDTREYAFGMSEHDTALMTVLRVSQDSLHRQVWARLVELNRTDPTTCSPSLSQHAARVSRGRYALIGQTTLDWLFPGGDHPDLRSYSISGFESITSGYIAVPKNTFYFSDLLAILVSIEESGLLEKLNSLYFPLVTYPKDDDNQISSNEAVTFYRIRLPVYCALAGVLLGSVCLLVEMMMKKCARKVYVISDVI